MRQFEKDPDAILDYTVDWSRWLDTDTILASQWTVPTGLTQVSSSNTSTSATAWLSGGTAGQAYTVANRITTADGRTDERSIVINVRDR